MKRALLIVAVFLLVAGAAYAEDVAYSSLTPKTAKSMAMGGVFTSVPTSEFSFFGNPAAFASRKAVLVLPSIDAWAYIKPTSDNLNALADSLSDTSALAGQALSLMGDNGGTGGGFSLGLGFAGKGLGLGFFTTNDEYIEGNNPASGIVHSDTEATAIIGLGLPIQLGDLLLCVGGDLRPFYRVRLFGAGHSDLALADLVKNKDDTDAMMASIYTDAFFGAAMDLGATLALDDFTIGLSIRDIAPSFPIASQDITELEDSLSAGNLPDTSDSTDSAVYTPSVTAGLSWTPRLLPGLIDPALYFELQDPVSVFKNGDGAGSALNLIHAGAEVKCLSIVSLRGGINRGWLSAGAGIKLLFIDVNMAFFTEELGALPGDKSRSGLALEAAFRF